MSLSSAQILIDGLKELELQMEIAPLLDYLFLLQKWNQTFNLTAVRNLNDMVTRHILDSLAIIPWIYGKRLLDVGSGAGLPGIPLALANANLEVVLLDSNGKKIRFLQEVKRALRLANIEVIHSRVENYHPVFSFDTVTSRALGKITQMVKWTTHLISRNGIWLAMKGRYPESELASINLPYEVKTYEVPGLHEKRCCVIIKNAPRNRELWRKL
jgi:16S rRNA (guanine527-N7)-methyltransferase